MKGFVNSVTLPYFVYLMYFLGVGFLGGAIVHFPVNPNLYGIIGAVGAIIFTFASTLNEWITNKRHVLHEGVIKILLYSLVLSIGLGMISGGIQHFVDFPIYASYLIPGGFIISLLGYVLSKEIKLDMQHKMLLVAKISLIAIPLFFILNTWAKTFNTTSGGHGHGAQVTNNQEAESHSAANESMNHEAVTNDEEFINQMIPHHQEAIDTSKLILTKTKNQKLNAFATGVVDVQSREMTQMKQWHSSWFGKEYEINSTYQPMMGDLTQLSNEELEKEYIKGMIAHHKGAIAMAKQIQPITQRLEIKKMADDIVTVQTKEIAILQNLLEGYAHEESEH
jgi:uncharacterized protein (DUF305 family)